LSACGHDGLFDEAHRPEKLALNSGEICGSRPANGTLHRTGCVENPSLAAGLSANDRIFFPWASKDSRNVARFFRAETATVSLLDPATTR
jgi:hypothetical protein